MDQSMKTLDIITIVTCVVTIIFLILWVWCAIVQQGLLLKIYADLEAIIEGYIPPATLSANITKQSTLRHPNPINTTVIEQLMTKVNKLVEDKAQSSITTT